MGKTGHLVQATLRGKIGLRRRSLSRLRAGSSIVPRNGGRKGKEGKGSGNKTVG